MKGFKVRISVVVGRFFNYSSENMFLVGKSSNGFSILPSGAVPTTTLSFKESNLFWSVNVKP